MGVRRSRTVSFEKRDATWDLIKYSFNAIRIRELRGNEDDGNTVVTAVIPR